MELRNIYKKLSNHFGHEVWWPHETTFEVMVGAFLTQNTAWRNVERAIKNLKKKELLDIKKLSKAGLKKLERAIRPAGFYRQKARRLLAFSKYLEMEYGGDLDIFFNRDVKIIRKELLSFKGIGKETADSMLLYAGNKLIFVIDSYTKRMCKRLEITNSIDYDELQLFFQNNLDKNLALYKQIHALIVELGKKFCKTVPLCRDCPLKKECIYYSRQGTSSKNKAEKVVIH